MDSTPSPVLIDVDGWPAYRFPDGRVRPVIRGGADDTGSDDDNGDQGGDQNTSDGGSGDDGGKAKTTPVAFTPEQQAHIDALIAKQHGKAKSQAEKEFKTWLEQQAMSETDRAKAEAAAKDDEVKAARLEVMQARVETTAERLALAAGVKPDRVEKFLKLVDLKDLDKLTDDGQPDRDAIKTLIDAELADAPEFKGAAGTGDGRAKSAAEFTPNSGKVWTRAEIAKLTPDEYEKHEDEILRQLASPAGIK